MQVYVTFLQREPPKETGRTYATPFGLMTLHNSATFENSKNNQYFVKTIVQNTLIVVLNYGKLFGPTDLCSDLHVVRLDPFFILPANFLIFFQI